MPLTEEDLDGSSGVLFPFYDADTNMLYVVGKVGGCPRPAAGGRTVGQAAGYLSPVGEPLPWGFLGPRPHLDPPQNGCVLGQTHQVLTHLCMHS